ncbi:hypothetical protein QN397_26330 [Variovorax sp. RTB1]|jgi:hypothetical protein|nr:hypothetical protein [Variovorax sp. RTB1]
MGLLEVRPTSGGQFKAGAIQDAKYGNYGLGVKIQRAQTSEAINASFAIGFSLAASWLIKNFLGV